MKKKRNGRYTDKAGKLNGWYTSIYGPDRHYLNGKLHREDGPAFADVSGYQAWYRNGLLHREDGPASVYPSGLVFWYLQGKRVEREDVLDTPEKLEAYLLEESLRRL